ncbi:hypothetical protein EIL87_12050 [Saccharopolyspora rhizosphaerae]|uniref:Uncharacterized protein n=1 Tax=Saccharopolyspora rhizosphaerae TaxID=2492662 RepID=A0A426JV08_9PSEU|nr:hypothetical protein [Saccharopolyspora rhizosphaerae]RRO17004.1 hypothetical protein EIL87_12050 [Saccharopolyspora rhizosphaerae]
MTTVNDAQQVRVQEGAAEPRLTWRRDEQNHFVRRWPWAQRTLAHIRELRTLAEFVRDQTPTSAGNAGNRVLLKDAESHLDVAENAVLGALVVAW